MGALPDSVVLESAAIDASPGAIWTAVSDPARFPEIYPRWIAAADAADGEEFWTATSKAGERFDIHPALDEATGTADFELIDELGMSTFFRTRIMPVAGGGCVVTQLATRVPGGSDADWQARRAALAADLAALATLIA